MVHEAALSRCVPIDKPFLHEEGGRESALNKSWPIALKINLFSLSHLDHVNYHDAYIDAYTITIKNKETEGYTISRFSILPYPFSLSK